MMGHAKLLYLGGIALMLAACGGKTVFGDLPADDGGAAGDGGSGGTAGSGGGTAGTGGIAGSGGVAGAGGSAGGSGGGIVACGRTYDRLDLEAILPDGTTFACWGDAIGNAEFDGVIVDTNPNGFLMDSCSPAMDCAGPMLISITYYAEGLQAYLPDGAFVHVTLSVEMPWGCEQRILVRNLPLWDGLPNPISPGRELYLAAADGTLATLPDSPFELNRYGLGCYPGAPSCGEPADDYLLAFRDENDPSDPGMSVSMGEQAEWVLANPNSNQYVTVRNLRSYVSGACDDDGNWAYWVTPSLFEAQ